MYRQNPSAPRRTISLAEPPRCTGSPSGPLPSIDQSTTIWAVSSPTNTWRSLAFNGRPRLISCWNWAAISVRSVMVRPSFVMNTASGAYKAIIASIFPELNRSSSDGITPSGFVGSGKDSDIRNLLFGVVEPQCGDDTRLAWVSDRSLIDTRWVANTDAGDQQGNTHTFFSTTLSHVRPRLLSALLDEIFDTGSHVAARDE